MVKPRYEFDAQQNAVIAGLATRLSVIGIVFFLIGFGVLIMSFVRTGNILAILIAGLSILFGAFAMYAGQTFRKITTTQTRDIETLMEAITTLTNVYNVQIVSMVLGAIAVAYFVWNIWK